MKKIIFVPRTIENITNNLDEKIGDLDKLRTDWGDKYQLLTASFAGKFDIRGDDQVYVMGGHGEVASAVVFWGPKTNSLTAEAAARLTAAKCPNSTGPVSIKVYSCHSGEGGYLSFAYQFALAFRPIGTYEVTIFGFRGAISVRPQELTPGNVGIAKAVDFYRQRGHYSPADYTGPKESVVPGVAHRWSKINALQYQSRASEARDVVATLKTEKGTRREWMNASPVNWKGRFG